MLELLQITNDPALARHCDKIGGFRLFVDWERNGKALRQAGRNSFISAHSMDDLNRVRSVVSLTPVMLRVNPLHVGTANEVAEGIARGADRLMLPMFRQASDLRAFLDIVDGRLPVTPLLEHVDAANTIAEWVEFDGIDEVFIGLNDLHLSLGQAFMYQPLADGLVDRLVGVARSAGRRVGFGGIARMGEGELAGRRVLGEHLRLGSQAVILSRTFHRFDVGGGSMSSMEDEVMLLRQTELTLGRRSATEIEQDRLLAISEVNEIVRQIQDSK